MSDYDNLCPCCGEIECAKDTDNVGGLLPCPFCGTVDKLYLTDYDHDVIGEYWMAGCRNHDCHSDSCCVDKPTRDEAIAAWNTRAYGELCRAAPTSLPDGDLKRLLDAAKLLESNGYSVCRAAPAGRDAVRDALTGQTIYLMGREHISDERKPMAELVYGMTVPGTGVLFCMKDTEAAIPKDAAPAGSVEVEELIDDLIQAASRIYDSGVSRMDRRLAETEISTARAALLRKLQQGADGWRPIESAPKNEPVLVFLAGQQFIAWYQDDLSDPFHDECDLSSDWNLMWVVTDNRNGPYPLRGGRPTNWMPLPEPPASQGQQGAE